MRFRSIVLSVCLLLLLFNSGRLAAQGGGKGAIKDTINGLYRIGTVLIVRSAGILAVPPGQQTIPQSTFSKGSLTPPGLAPGNDMRMLTVGRRVNVGQIDVNVKADKITLLIVECDACNASETSSYRAYIGFQFAKGFLEKSSPAQIQETIDKLLPVDHEMNRAASANQPAPPNSVFVSQANPKDVLDLRSDNSFRLFEKGGKVTGTYEWSGGTLILNAGKQRMVAYLAGDILTDNEGKPWKATASAGLAAPVAPVVGSGSPAGRGQAQPPGTIALGQTVEQVVATFGEPTKIVRLGAKQIYFYNSLKVTFQDGKVSDVE